MLKLIDILYENIITEYSKNDAIPELSRYNDHLCVFIFGPPASGKSTFVKNFILRLNNKFTVVNPDDMDYLRRQKSYDNPKVRGTSKLSIKRAESILQTGNNMIYDTTGNDFNRISILSKIAQENKYTVVFIHLIDSLNNIINKAAQRDRPTDVDYIQSSYEKTQKLIKQFYDDLHPDSYYIITTIGGKYTFYKYDGSKLLKKKSDIYK